MRLKLKDSLIEIAEGDITAYHADALFCPDTLKIPMIKGLSQIVLNKAGSEILAATRASLPSELGDVIYTKAGNLSYTFIFFGAVLHPDGEVDRDIVEKALKKTLNLCSELSLASVVFPMISSPTSRIPFDMFSHVILRTIIDSVLIKDTCLKTISVVTMNKEAFSSLKAQLELLRQEYLI